MIRCALGRYIRYWYTYRTAVAVVIAILLSGGIFWLYTQQLTCDPGARCAVNIAVHPEDRLVAQSNPDPNVVIVGVVFHVLVARTLLEDLKANDAAA